MTWDLGTITVHGKRGDDMASTSSAFDDMMRKSAETWETGIGAKTGTKSSGWNLGSVFSMGNVSWGKVALIGGAVLLLVLVLKRR